MMVVSTFGLIFKPKNGYAKNRTDTVKSPIHKNFFFDNHFFFHEKYARLRGLSTKSSGVTMGPAFISPVCYNKIANFNILRNLGITSRGFYRILR